MKQDWYQTDSDLILTLFIKQVKPEQCQIEFHPLQLSVAISQGSTETSLELDLQHEILPELSTFELLTTKVEIKLKKKTIGLKWTALEALETQQVQPKPKKDWDSIVNQEEDSKPQGEQALNALFQQIYANADDNTKKAMMKSYIESNGTCLSTNWNEVGHKTVQVTPPDGMIAKKFES
jgi:suppressor of G2 allele of SKP1